MFRYNSFHRRWNAAVHVRHPSLWVLICRLKDEERKTTRAARHLANGGILVSRKLKWRRLEERIVSLRQEYNAGTRTLQQYWSAVKYAVHHQ